MLGVLAVLVGALTVTGDAAPRTNAAAAPTSVPSSTPSTSAGVPGWAPTTPSPRVSSGRPTPSDLTATAVRIDAIGVRSELLALRLDAAGVLIPPDVYDEAGWLTGGPVPGEVGPAVIAGHVDSRADGPGVFFRLAELRAGDVVVVTRSDDSEVRFTVTQVEQYPKNRFPTQRVYGPTPDQQLRLITCGGDFDSGRRSYRDNIVVYAEQQGTIT